MSESSSNLLARRNFFKSEHVVVTGPIVHVQIDVQKYVDCYVITRAESWVPCTRNRTGSDSDPYPKIDTRYTGFWYCKFKKCQMKENSFQNDVFPFKLALDYETLDVQKCFSVSLWIAESKTHLHVYECFARAFIAILCVCRNCEQKFEDVWLYFEIKRQNFIAVTSVLQILFILHVMFRVYVYWSCSDTYPVFRTRFSPSLEWGMIIGCEPLSVGHHTSYTFALFYMFSNVT